MHGLSVCALPAFLSPFRSGRFRRRADMDTCIPGGRSVRSRPRPATGRAALILLLLVHYISSQICSRFTNVVWPNFVDFSLVCHTCISLRHPRFLQPVTCPFVFSFVRQCTLPHPLSSAADLFAVLSFSFSWGTLLRPGALGSVCAYGRRPALSPEWGRRPAVCCCTHEAHGGLSRACLQSILHLPSPTFGVRTTCALE